MIRHNSFLNDIIRLNTKIFVSTHLKVFWMIEDLSCVFSNKRIIKVSSIEAVNDNNIILTNGIIVTNISSIHCLGAMEVGVMEVEGSRGVQWWKQGQGITARWMTSSQL